jgi:ketosteroid isomerase-like protein
MKNGIYIVFVILFFTSCMGLNQKDVKAKAIHEIEKAELDFAKLAADSGIHIAFTNYADENAVINTKKDSLIKGLNGISNFYNNAKLKQVKLTWKPDFVDAAISGELGYTYGKYHYDLTDSVGKHSIYNGYFHTVWKKNASGVWKFVWD